jgi:hypothetical protein
LKASAILGQVNKFGPLLDSEIKNQMFIHVESSHPRRFERRLRVNVCLPCAEEGVHDSGVVSDARDSPFVLHTYKQFATIGVSEGDKSLTDIPTNELGIPRRLPIRRPVPRALELTEVALPE